VVDFQLTPEQEMVRRTAREFAEREIAPFAREWDREERMDRSIVGRLAGVGFLALNGGPHFKLNEAFSLSIDCRSQAEVDELWEKLSAGGTPGRCGWLKDRYGLSWQVVPAVLPELLGSPDRAKAGRVMQAMMGMTKLDIAALEAAADGR